MFSRSSVHHWLLRFAVGAALIAAAGTGVFLHLLGGENPLGMATILPGLAGFFLALSSITPLVRLMTMEARTRRAWTEAAATAFARASLPRRVYYLLAAVAEADGPMSDAERATVRHFVLERFAEPIDPDSLQTWEAQPLSITDRIGLAARIAPQLDETELDSLFCWCCFVAFADGNYREPEHRALQEVAKGLGLDAGRARMLFHLARAQFLGGQTTGNRERPRSEPATPADARLRALDVLGLPADATIDTIRKRHRQLARQFHPDAQPSLGPVAMREATERFQQIQRAYEVLTRA